MSIVLSNQLRLISTLTPAQQVAAIASLQLWVEGTTGNVYKDTGGLTPATLTGDAIALKKTLKAGLPDRSQATGALQPTLNPDGANYIGANSNIMTGGAVAFPGKFSLYACGWNGLGAAWLPFGSAAGTALAGIISAQGFTGVYNDGVGSVFSSWTGWPKMMVLRFRRDAANTIWGKFGGVNEINYGTLTGTCTFDSEGRGSRAPNYSDGTHTASLAFSDDLIATADDATVMTYLNTLGYGFSPAITNQVKIEGDSIAQGYNTPTGSEARSGWQNRMMPFLKYGCTLTNYASSGATSAGVLAGANWATYGASMTAHDVVCLAVGTNDGFTVGAFNNVVSIVNAMIAAGVKKIGVQTGLPRSPGTTEAARQTFNTSIRNQAWPAGVFVVDPGSDALMGQAGQYSSAYFSPDGVHPSVLGHQRLDSVYWRPAINANI